jgi:Rho family protein
VESKWVGEIADNCQGVKLVLVALKCDLREAAGDDGPEKNVPGGFIQYPEGLAAAQRIRV